MRPDGHPLTRTRSSARARARARGVVQVLLLALVGLGALSACRGPGPSEAGPAAASGAADLVLRGGVIHTVDDLRPRVSAVAARDGRIVFVGDEADVEAWIGPGTEVVELSGRAAYPGFADAHMHLLGYGLARLEVDLVGTVSYADVIARIATAAREQPAGTWITGRGWDQTDWDVTDFPHHEALSRVVPDHPVAVRRVDGHALLANARALDAAAVLQGHGSRAALRWDGEGGRVLTDSAGPTGVLIDNAIGLVTSAIPETEDDDRRREALALGIAGLHRQGVTSIHDAGVRHDVIQLYAEAARAGAFTLRNHVMLTPGDDELTAALAGRPSPYPTDDLTGNGLIAVRAIKLYVDGALGSRGALLLEDYSDEPHHRGLQVLPDETIHEITAASLRQGFQVCVHAIGDAGNRRVLDLFEQALAEVPVQDRAVAEPQFRIEHAQVLSPEDIPRFARMGVIPSMQALHQTSDMPWAEARLGSERVRGAYAWRALLDTGVIIPGGTDAPVERPDPIASFHAAVTRRDEAGTPPGGWYPDQRMTRAEALRHLTLWPAMAAFVEDEQGSITLGKRADFVILSDDLMTVPAESMVGIEVELTVFDGHVVYDRAAESGG